MSSLFRSAENAKNGQLDFGEATRSPKNLSRQNELSSKGTLKADPEGSKPFNAVSIPPITCPENAILPQLPEDNSICRL